MVWHTSLEGRSSCYGDLMLTLAIDPGPSTCGAALYDPGRRAVLWSSKAAPVVMLSDLLWLPTPDAPWWGHDLLVLVERVQSYGIAGRHLLETSEAVGRLWRSAEAGGHDVRLVPRRLVCLSLDVSGGGKDAQVRRRCVEVLGPRGTKRDPGPTYGVTSHGWQALGLALAYHEAPPTLRARMDEECRP